MRDGDDSAFSTWGPVGGVALFGVALVIGASHWPSLMYSTGLAAHLPFKGSEENALPLHPFAELLKLIVAALVGIVVTAVHKRYHRDKALPRLPLASHVVSRPRGHCQTAVPCVCRRRRAERQAQRRS